MFKLINHAFSYSALILAPKYLLIGDIYSLYRYMMTDENDKENNYA